MLLEGKRIFVVEDNVGTYALIQLLLEQHGAQVIFGQDSAKIMDTLQAADPIHLIVLDLMLWDGITGHNIYDEIRAISDYDHIPIVAVTAADPNTAMHETRTRGFSGYIGKPIDFNLFPQQIAKILEGQSIWFVRE